MTNYKNKSVCVFDNGLFVELAVTLTKFFGTVYYYCPWTDGYPKSNRLLIGQGIPNVRRLRDLWEAVDEIDLFVFPDVYEGDLQIHLANIGKRVWGCRNGAELELDRVASKEHCKKVGIDIGPYKAIRGLDALRTFLKENDNQYVKVSATRGDMETFKASSYRLIEPRLDELEHTLGARKRIQEFVVEAAIEPAVEVGYDGYVIDGKFPKRAFYGIEVKDKGFIGRTKPYEKLPEEIKDCNEKLGPTFREFKYRGFYSSEVRITPEHKAYLIDPCCRCGSPPNEIYQLLFTNLADILWEGAAGVVVEPEFAGKWGAELLLISSWADKNWQAIEFPKSIRDNVKLRNMTMIEGRYYFVPQWTGMPEIGAVVAIGNSQKEVVDECRRLAEKVQGHYVEVFPDSLDSASDEIEKLAKYGIEF